MSSELAATGPSEAASATVRKAGGGVFRLRGKLKTAVDSMIWPAADGAAPLTWQEAAKAVNLSPRQMRLALEKNEVRQYIRAQRAAFRASISTKNEYALASVRDTSGNGMAVVAAVRALDNLVEADAAANPGGAVRSPGVVIVINHDRPRPPADDTIIELNPISERAEDDVVG